MPPDYFPALGSLGTTLGPDLLTQTLQLFDTDQKQLVEKISATATDIKYGDHERQRLDIYVPSKSTGAIPILVFIHGGGFLKGDKGNDTHWNNSNVGRFAALNGYMGIVPNYRLAPENQWPSGAEDVASVIHWIKQEISVYGGNSEQIILIGTSAGAYHIASYHQLNSEEPSVKGLILLSGLYGVDALDTRDKLYFGERESYQQQMPLVCLSQTQLPLMIVCTQYDPIRFQNEYLGLVQAIFKTQKRLPNSRVISNHNHYSVASHLGSRDTRLAKDILNFLKINFQA